MSTHVRPATYGNRMKSGFNSPHEDSRGTLKRRKPDKQAHWADSFARMMCWRRKAVSVANGFIRQRDSVAGCRKTALLNKARTAQAQRPRVTSNRQWNVLPNRNQQLQRHERNQHAHRNKSRIAAASPIAASQSLSRAFSRLFKCVSCRAHIWRRGRAGFGLVWAWRLPRDGSRCA